MIHSFCTLDKCTEGRYKSDLFLVLMVCTTKLDLNKFKFLTTKSNKESMYCDCYNVYWVNSGITWNFWRKSCTEEFLGIRECHVIITFFYRNLASQCNQTIGVCQERGVDTYVQWRLLTSWMKPGCPSYRTFHCATYLFITQILEISKCFCFAAII